MSKDQPEAAPEADAQANETKTFALTAGAVDADVLREYLESLKPEQSDKALSQMLSRALEIEWSEGEKESILRDVVLQAAHTSDVEVLPGLVLTFRSLSEDDHQWVLTRELGEIASNDPRLLRTRNVRFLSAVVIAVGGTKLAGDREKRRDYWTKQVSHLVESATRAAQRFDNKVRAALTDEETWGNS